MIKQPSVKITILRDPIKTFESRYVYLNVQAYYDMNINEFAQALNNGKILKWKRRTHPLFDQN